MDEMKIVIDRVTAQTQMMDRLFAKSNQQQDTVIIPPKDDKPIIPDVIPDEIKNDDKDEVQVTKRVVSEQQAFKIASSFKDNKLTNYGVAVLEQATGARWLFIRLWDTAPKKTTRQDKLTEYCKVINNALGSTAISVADLYDANPNFDRVYLPLGQELDGTIQHPVWNKEFNPINVGTIPYTYQWERPVLEGNISHDTALQLATMFQGIVDGLNFVADTYYYPSKPKKIGQRYPMWLIWAEKDEENSLTRVLPAGIKPYLLNDHSRKIDGKNVKTSDVYLQTIGWVYKSSLDDSNIYAIPIDLTDQLDNLNMWTGSGHNKSGNGPLTCKSLFPELVKADPNTFKAKFTSAVSVLNELKGVLGLIPGVGMYATTAIMAANTIVNLMNQKGMKVSDMVPKNLNTDVTGDIAPSTFTIDDLVLASSKLTLTGTERQQIAALQSYYNDVYKPKSCFLMLLLRYFGFMTILTDERARNIVTLNFTKVWADLLLQDDAQEQMSLWLEEQATVIKTKTQQIPSLWK